MRNQIRQKRYQERLRSELDRSLEMAVTDPLTGLRNRRYVRRHLEGMLRQGGAALLMMDVDRFKAINDTHGHGAGDIVLREVAERVRAHLRASDVVARYGGEEFLVVMAGTGEDEARVAAERLRMAIDSTPITADGQSLWVTASIGVAASEVSGEADALLSAADAALYEAKNGGRNRVVVASAVPALGRTVG